MKKIIFRKYNAVISFFLAILGISNSCNLSRTLEYGAPTQEYGTPHALYKVHGTISSKTTGAAVSGIEVTMQGDSTLTDNLGNYALEVYDFPEDKTYIVSAKDVDGTTNGSFADKDTLVEFKETELSGGDGDWDSGEVDKTVNIKIEEKK